MLNADEGVTYAPPPQTETKGLSTWALLSLYSNLFHYFPIPFRYQQTGLQHDLYGKQ